MTVSGLRRECLESSVGGLRKLESYNGAQTTPPKVTALVAHLSTILAMASTYPLPCFPLDGVQAKKLALGDLGSHRLAPYGFNWLEEHRL